MKVFPTVPVEVFIYIYLVQVCGSDGNWYKNRCETKKRSCVRRRRIRPVNIARCAGKEPLFSTDSTTRKTKATSLTTTPITTTSSTTSLTSIATSTTPATTALTTSTTTSTVGIGTTTLPEATGTAITTTERKAVTGRCHL